ncbi:esterase-like activity of phytase family protein [Streptomyces cellulosae]|nr:esterase-like activity of phytase family protein [Streptomyces cellulosae]
MRHGSPARHRRRALEILAVDRTDYLTVERSFASGVGFSIRLY